MSFTVFSHYVKFSFKNLQKNHQKLFQKPSSKTMNKSATVLLQRKSIRGIYTVFNNLNALVPSPVFTTQIYAAHTDVKVPDFNKYRKRSVRDPTVPTDCSDAARKTLSYALSGTLATVALYGLKTELTRYVMYLSASADVLALSQIEINMAEVPEGKATTYKWRGKPLFVRHRTAEEIAGAQAVPVQSLRDPEEDSKRCPNPSWLIVIGVCTHLGCVPIANAGDFGPGGYYCPCHGSHFDAAGRVRKGPAPINLVMPPYKFAGDKIIVG